MLMTPFMTNRLSECYASDRVWEKVKKMNTNTYVWGNGQQVDSSQEYSNFTPKNMKPFKGKEQPDIIDVAFGMYHEAYIDKEGNLYVCAKGTMSSIKVKEQPNGVRQLHQVKSLPKGTKIRMVSFTRRRMFVLGQDGKLYVFRVDEKRADREEEILSKKPGPVFTGQIVIDKPIFVKDLPPLSMVAAGDDHVLMLDNKGEVWAMGDDTFGQCGQGSENR